MEEQHKFHLGRSTTTANLIFNHFIFDVFRSTSQVDVIFTDFHKSFDTVNHSILIKSLEAVGFGMTLLSWFKFYLDFHY